jgi:ABC-2 type transport system ATP-binding protein
MSEMALTADRLIVVGKGRPITEGTVDDVVGRSSTGHVRVATADPRSLHRLLHDSGAGVEAQADNTLIVTGMDARDIGVIAGAAGITRYELSPRSASLEEAFMELTRDASEYHASGDLATTSRGVAA